jgi:hypothetical protein
MPIHYSMIDVLDQIERIAVDGRDKYNILIPIENSALPAKPSEALFVLQSTPKICDFNNQQSVHEFGTLLKDTPLYHINMQLALDHALSQRHHNSKIEYALEKAFAPDPLPNVLSSDEEFSEDFAGSLRHPMLEHIDTATLCQYYVEMLKNLPRDYGDYSFEKNILGKHPARFSEMFDGYVSEDGGKVRAEILIAFGARPAQDMNSSLDMHRERGHTKALKYRSDDVRELLWIWLEANEHQRRRAHIAHRLLRIGGLPRLPQWVKADIYSFFEKEQFKITLSKHILSLDNDLSLLPTSLLADVIRKNAENEFEPLLKMLYDEVINDGPLIYLGAAGRYFEQLNQIHKDSQRARL